MKNFFCLIFILFYSTTFSFVNAIDFVDGRIKLSIDEKIGRFSLYYMTDVDKKIYEPLFWAKDKRTSFLSVDVNDKEYKLGESSAFKVVVRGTDKRPVLAYESPLISITEEFSFIRTASSGVSNGVRIDVRVENWGEDKKSVGIRMLIDTFLGEKTNPNFRTDTRPIPSELVINKSSYDQYWVSRNDEYGIMGSVFVDGVDPPDFIHFANWKRLSDARFEAEYVASRNFSIMPFSAKDSAVCYYLSARPMKKWEQASMSILLAAEDQYGFDISKVKVAPSYDSYNSYNVYDANTPKEQEVQKEVLQKELSTAIRETQFAENNNGVPMTNNVKRRSNVILPIGPMRLDLMTLRELIYKVDSYIYSGNKISEAELKAMENAIIVLKAKYGSVFSAY
ncbi:MAG: hypothetical protein Ta2B_27070 [Termitinemataceae bacterium]|nr:MAG: hypothetical protein Ta2B_27070 [Termitinemataceae bacterium]